jgi:hypothetical protein
MEVRLPVAVIEGLAIGQSITTHCRYTKEGAKRRGRLGVVGINTRPLLARAPGPRLRLDTNTHLGPVRQSQRLEQV